MLSAPARLTRSADFSEVVRAGRRAGRPLLTLHLLAGADPTGPADRRSDSARSGGGPDRPTRAGLVVGKAVGGSVVRSRTSRRLRHLLRDRMSALPPGGRLVVRAAPAAGTATSAQLAHDLDAALARLRRAGSR